MIFERLASWAEALNDTLDRHRFVILIGLTAWLAVLLQAFARGKPFWHDEVYTILSSQLGLRALWRASLDGLDLSPPLNTLITHWLHASIGDGLVITRSPAMAGFLGAVILVFIAVQRKTNAMCGLIAALILCFTPAWLYGFEARGYGLTLGAFAAALYCWSEAAAQRRPNLHWTMMAIALAAGVWAHYYAIFAFLPIVAGETVRQVRARNVQRAAWIALASAVAALAPLWPLIAAARTQRSTFWTRAEPHDLGSTYAFVAGDFGRPGFAATVFSLVVIGVIVMRIASRGSLRQLPAHDRAACVACIALPAAAVILGQSVAVFTERYLVFATVGLAFATAELLWWWSPRHGFGETVAALALVAMLIAFTTRTIVAPPEWTDPTDYHPVLTQALATTPETIAMTGGVAFLGVWYNSPEHAKQRMIYLADPDAQRRLTGTDTLDLGYLALARWTALRVAPTSEFARAHDRFLLYSFGSGWSEQTLKSGGAILTPRAQSGGGSAVLYEVVRR